MTVVVYFLSKTLLQKKCLFIKAYKINFAKIVNK